MAHHLHGSEMWVVDFEDSVELRFWYIMNFRKCEAFVHPDFFFFKLKNPGVNSSA